MRTIFNAGGFGTMVYSEGEYYHYAAEPLDSYKRLAYRRPAAVVSTHSNAYYVCVTWRPFHPRSSCLASPASSSTPSSAQQRL